VGDEAPGIGDDGLITDRIVPIAAGRAQAVGLRETRNFKESMTMYRRGVALSIRRTIGMGKLPEQFLRSRHNIPRNFFCPNISVGTLILI